MEGEEHMCVWGGFMEDPVIASDVPIMLLKSFLFQSFILQSCSFNHAPSIMLLQSFLLQSCSQDIREECYREMV
jgi:hypothetical protein